MRIHLYNAWLFAVPVIIVGVYIAVFHRDTAKRMADMTGYSRQEKTIAVSASTAPYLFTLLTIFIPLSSNTIAVFIGVPLYSFGVIGFVTAVVSYIQAPSEALAAHGIYRISRNPMYVTALLAYAGIAVMTLNFLLTILLFIMIILHHMMILSEERACANRFGDQYEKYRENTPRYLFL